MASYVLAGKADDVSFARAEFAAKKIEAACPNVYFRYEMKHPDIWQEFINSVFTKYDFDGFAEDFPGPLVWTHEGDLVGGSAEFIQHVIVEKFGLPPPPDVTHSMFKDIARDNMKQVKLQQHQEIHGAPFGERCATANKRALAAGLFSPPVWAEQKLVVVEGATMEVWISDTLNAERAKLREDFGNGESSQVDARLLVTSAGPEQSHSVLLHPRPFVTKHLVLPPRRLLKDIVGESGSAEFLEVPPSSFRSNVDEDLGLADFAAAMEVMSSIGGLACWMGLRRGSEYRDPLDTHLHVLPFPVHHHGEDSPLRYPLELHCERALKDGAKTLKAFPFQHSFAPLADPAERKGPDELAKLALKVYEQVKGKPSKADACAVAFTSSWLIYMPLEPPELDSARHEAWLQMPPPPPCALCGIVACPRVAEGYPETVRLPQAAGSQLVSTRAEEEGIPEDSPEFDAANRMVRIATKIMELPLEIMGVWGLPGQPKKDRRQK